MISPDSLIPPDSELAQHLLQWSEEMDKSVWDIANTTNELIEEVVGNGISKQDIYKAVSSRCKGQKPNTIRRWSEVAADFDMDIQEKYAQLLSFEHFKVSRRLYNEGYTPTIEYGLDWCVSGNDYKVSAGTFHTVGQMINQFVPKDVLMKPADVIWDGIKEQLYDSFLMIENDFYRNQLLDNWKEIGYNLSELKKSKA